MFLLNIPTLFLVAGPITADASEGGLAMIPEGMDGCRNGPEDDNCPVTAEVVALDGVGNADGSCMLAKFGVAGDCPTFSLGTEGAAPTRNVDSRFSSIGPATHRRQCKLQILYSRIWWQL